jgi:CBS domain-containing protein
MTYVSEAMHSGVDRVAPDAGLAELARIMRDKDIGAIPVSDGKSLLGIVTDRDIALRGFVGDGQASAMTAADIMSKPVVFCHADDSIEDAIRLMESRQVRRLPVVDDQSSMVGILSLGDVSHCGHRDLAIEVMGAVSSHHA